MPVRAPVIHSGHISHSINALTASAQIPSVPSCRVDRAAIAASSTTPKLAQRSLQAFRGVAPLPNTGTLSRTADQKRLRAAMLPFPARHGHRMLAGSRATIARRNTLLLVGELADALTGNRAHRVTRSAILHKRCAWGVRTTYSWGVTLPPDPQLDQGGRTGGALLGVRRIFGNPL